jgi:hypothetical protein
MRETEARRQMENLSGRVLVELRQVGRRPARLVLVPPSGPGPFDVRLLSHAAEMRLPLARALILYFGSRLSPAEAKARAARSPVPLAEGLDAAVAMGLSRVFLAYGPVEVVEASG